MNVILLERFGNLGDLGEEVVVKAGFARNFLIPQGKAVRATQENRAVFEERRAELEKAATDLLTVAQGRARSLQELTITIVVKAGEEGKLYGSVGTQDIADVVSEQREPVTKSEVRLPEGVIRVLGDYNIDLQLHSDVTVPIKLSVVAE
jgi:large subunit ribosomal protein L9